MSTSVGTSFTVDEDGDIAVSSFGLNLTLGLSKFSPSDLGRLIRRALALCADQGYDPKLELTDLSVANTENLVNAYFSKWLELLPNAPVVGLDLSSVPELVLSNVVQAGQRELDARDRRSTDKLSLSRVHQLRSSIKLDCALLRDRGESLPETVSYQPQSATHFFDLPHEIREKVYQYHGIQTILPKKRRLTHFVPEYVLELTTNGLHRLPHQNARPSKRRRFTIDAAADTHELSVPTAIYSFDAPIQVPALSLTCKQKFQELVVDRINTHTLGVKVCCADLESPITESFWTQLVPWWLRQLVKVVNIEIRCTIKQARQIEDNLKAMLTAFPCQIHVRLRLCILFSKAEAQVLTDSLPLCLAKDEHAMRNLLAHSWVPAHSKSLVDEFSWVQSVTCILQCQLVFLNKPQSRLIRERYSVHEIGYIAILLHNGQVWGKFGTSDFPYTDNNVTRFVSINGTHLSDL